MPDYSETPGDPQATFMKTWWKAVALCLLMSLFLILGYILPWQDVAAKISLLSILLAFLSTDLGHVLKKIFGRRMHRRIRWLALIVDPEKIFGRRVHRRIRWLASIVDPDISVTIWEYEGPSRMRRRSDAYEEVKAYLGESCSLKARHLIGETPRKDIADKRLEVSMREEEEVADERIEIEGTSFTVWWSLFTRKIGQDEDELGYTVYYQERHRDLVVDTYLPHVRRKGRDLIRSRQRMIVTNTPGQGWTSSMPFNHPKTFETLAMDPRTKQDIIADLKKFQQGRKYYAEQLGRPWKRGYLLHGPPGTGKSSMIAAMANFLNYDVYDIELTSVTSNTELRSLLIDTKSKSLIVIEDIDRSLDLTRARKDRDGDGDDDGGASASVPAGNVAQDKKAKATSRCSTLSGLLNFIDGLWSACGEERIIVFTTNYKDELDPALIRKGRMDKHIEMSYCGFEAFKLLAKLYLQVDSHPQFGAIEQLLRDVEMTPADVAEHLTPKSNDDNAADSCLKGLVAELMKSPKKEGKGNGARIADAAPEVLN